MKVPTCAEIAVACGVSASTVSRALNNHPAIPDITRKQVVEIARRMGWRPNPLISAHMSHLRSTRPTSFKAILGVIVDFPIPRGPEDLPSHVRRTYRGFERRAKEYGYTVKTFNLTDPDMSFDSLDRAMSNWNIPGFLVTSLSQPGKVLREMNWSRYAMVAFGYSMKSPKIHRVVLNMQMGIRFAINQAFRMGYQRLGVAVSEQYDRRTNHGVMYPVSFMARNLRSGQSINAFVYDESDPAMLKKIAGWLKRTRPELVMGMFGSEVFDHLGWKVPGDIARIAFDRSPESPSQAGLDLRYEVGGGLAADVLISEITLNRRGIPENPVEYTVACKWRNGGSAPPVSASSAEREL